MNNDCTLQLFKLTKLVKHTRCGGPLDVREGLIDLVLGLSFADGIGQGIELVCEDATSVHAFQLLLLGRYGLENSWGNFLQGHFLGKTGKNTYPELRLNNVD